VDPTCAFPSGRRRTTQSKFAKLRWHGAAALALLVAFLVHREEPETAAPKALQKTLSVSRVGKPTPDAPAESHASARCLSERQRLLTQPGLPGAPAFEAARTLILGHAKAEPVLLVQAPKLEKSDDPAVRRYQRTFELARYPWDVLRWLVPRFVHHPEHGRKALLREGYLYAETPELAFALVDHVSAHHLFDDERIWVQRGELTLFAQRGKDGKYRYENGSQAGKPVRLLLLDRIGTGQPPPALHRDLRTLRYRLGFDAARVVHMTESRLVADLRYGSDWVPTVLRTEGARVELDCEAPPPAALARVALVRQRAARLQQALLPLYRAMLAQIEEQLPFDEPVTEYGQQDGHMRFRWLQAYLAGRNSYTFNKDRYFVYDEQGRPKPPQVCIDFLYDTFERASGTWWQPRNLNPKRTTGRVDFGTFTNTPLRRADRFIELARAQNQRFDVYELSAQERIPMWKREAFFGQLSARADDFRPGDIVMIRGYTSFERRWERKVMHYHSFFVYESDPVTGMPIALVGNPGRPSIRTWLFEGLRTPKRSIWYRVRPKLEWLEDALEPHRDVATVEPPSLSVGPA
jgi:hypothetical protein